MEQGNLAVWWTHHNNHWVNYPIYIQCQWPLETSQPTNIFRSGRASVRARSLIHSTENHIQEESHLEDLLNHSRRRCEWAEKPNFKWQWFWWLRFCVALTSKSIIRNAVFGILTLLRFWTLCNHSNLLGLCFLFFVVSLLENLCKYKNKSAQLQMRFLLLRLYMIL